MVGYNEVIDLVRRRTSLVVADVSLVFRQASIQTLGNYFTLGLVSPYDPLAAPDKIGKSVCVKLFFKRNSTAIC